MPNTYESPRVPKKRLRNIVEIVDVDESWAEQLLDECAQEEIKVKPAPNYVREEVRLQEEKIGRWMGLSAIEYQILARQKKEKQDQ